MPSNRGPAGLGLKSLPSVVRSGPRGISLEVSLLLSREGGSPPVKALLSRAVRRPGSMDMHVLFTTLPGRPRHRVSLGLCCQEVSAPRTHFTSCARFPQKDPPSAVRLQVSEAVNAGCSPALSNYPSYSFSSKLNPFRLCYPIIWKVASCGRNTCIPLFIWQLFIGVFNKFWNMGFEERWPWISS